MVDLIYINGVQVPNMWKVSILNSGSLQGCGGSVSVVSRAQEDMPRMAVCCYILDPGVCLHSRHPHPPGETQHFTRVLLCWVL